MDQSITHKGWFVDTLFKQVHGILADFGYACNEHTAWIIPLRGPDGNISANAVGVKWRAVRDLEYKYAEGVFEVKVAGALSQKPKPGTDPKSGQTASFGSITTRFHGLVRTDSKFIWQKSPILKYLLPIREKYFYLGRIEKFRQMMRQDWENISAAIKKYMNYLPAVA
jgi:hypothetical protein